VEHIEKSFYFFFLAPPHSISLLGQALRTFIHIDFGLFAPISFTLFSIHLLLSLTLTYIFQESFEGFRKILTK